MLTGPHLFALTGHRLIAVDGGSMAPTYLPGDIVITSPPTGDDLHVGRILVIGTPPDLYTHRVVEVRDRGATVVARLQGDANTVRDPGWIEQTDVHAIPTARLTGPAADALGAVSNPIGRGALVAGTAALLWWPRSSTRTRDRSTPR
ncbi:hypothetical protein [Aeromicrobium sp. PE09-221]|uniref:hypothetical protein n=1 Tax=Aeromicrobium sp. PE09-221 TaxID=1898043 RepID=UPI0011245F25|nr:hypothetical protein [Aeromicrobium sp. PE09-221]